MHLSFGFFPDAWVYGTKKHQSPGSGQSIEHVRVLLTNRIYNGQQLHSMFIKKKKIA